MTETVLIVAAHPDDEVLGVGGTAARHVDEGHIVHTLILAEGATARSQDSSKGSPEELQALQQAAQAAAHVLGTQPPRFAGLPDNRLDAMDLLDIIKKVELHLREIAPTIVYTHHGGDLNIDHLMTHRATLTACRPLPGQSVRALYTFETLSSSEWGSGDQGLPFRPLHFVDISSTLERKMSALRCYDQEMRAFPHARSYNAIEALATLRGAQSGLPEAEAFNIVRSFWN